MNLNFLPKVLVLLAALFHLGQVVGKTAGGLIQLQASQVGISRNDEDKCPPCFNCMLPIFECKQFSTCNSYTGRCECQAGFGGEDCSLPVCGALSEHNERRPVRDSNDTCHCDSGWGGINCNICQMDAVCDSFVPEGLKGTCYKGGVIVNSVHQGCDVTNKKIIEMLQGPTPHVTFSCNKTSEECNFQFWIDQIESFYCGLDTCKFDYDPKSNITHYRCEEVQCKCIPDRMLCGQKGSIDISEFLTETIRGPGDFTCNINTKRCQFSEPSMNELIQSVFGDPYIMLKCASGECLHYTSLPGYETPGKQKLTASQIFVLFLTSMIVISASASVVYYVAQSPLFGNGGIALPEEDSKPDEDVLKTNAKASMTFENITYEVFTEGKTKSKVLNSISGTVLPGEILAIIGSSGAGKTCLLDILAMKNKSGEVSGTIKVNGAEVDKTNYSKIIGFIDQEDFLLPTLTVYETVLNSALLRLPESMSFAAKQKRVYEVLEELRIFDIRDRLIGNEFDRGISGGEKRRVSIACEMVTSPLILFLDEPTSGLDSNNANNVIDCLVRLATHYNRTLVLSIHQPRSNVFQLFDKIVLLSAGELVYSGDSTRVSDFLRNNGFTCPTDYNIADFLIDITIEPQKYMKPTIVGQSDIEAVAGHIHEGNIHTPELVGSSTQREWEHFALHRDELRGMLQTQDGAGSDSSISAYYSYLYRKFRDGPYAAELYARIDSINSDPAFINLELPTPHETASFMQQLSILNSRTFKNVYRNPKLLLANYTTTVLLGLFLGTLYHNVENDISGFQNRLGLFLFVLTYFGFLTFTGLSSFAMERIIFVKERSNHYYTPAAYYLSKIISDVLPLRVIPPILLCVIMYPLVGLNMTHHAFSRCIFILILFNLSIALEILAVGIIFKDLNTSLIISVLILLGSLLFSGLFINMKELSNAAFKYMKNFSVFYYAYEALIINEVKSLTLREKKYGLNIEIPGATILSTFGFSVGDMALDINILVLFNIIFMLLGYAFLELLVVERK